MRVHLPGLTTRSKRPFAVVWKLGLSARRTHGSTGQPRMNTNHSLLLLISHSQASGPCLARVLRRPEFITNNPYEVVVGFYYTIV